MQKLLKLLKNIGVLVYCCFILVMLGKAFRYLLIDDTNSYTRLTLHELYSESENIDILFLGSSHCMRTFDCNIGDQILEKNTFNGGTSSQFLDGSYAFLVEAGKYNELEEVWIELYYGQLGRKNSERTELTSTYAISDYMKMSFNKFYFLLNASTSDYYVNGFFPARRSWERMFEPDYIKNLMAAKHSSAYKNYAYLDSYKGKGFLAENTQIDKGTYIRKDYFWSVEELTEDDKKYLKAIISYCEKNSIELHFFSAPMSDFRLVSLGNYDNYVNAVSEFLSEHGYDYYDFNLCKPEYLSLDETYFFDDNHLNYRGAEQVTELVCSLIKETAAINDILYESYDEKIMRQDDRVYGIQIFDEADSDSPEEKDIYTIKAIANFEPDLRYTVKKMVNGHPEEVILLEKDENPQFIIDQGEEGVLFFEVYYKDELVNHSSFPY